MKTTKITAEEAAQLSVASLPTRPTAATSYGGKGYTSTEMKEAFDRLPLLAIERLNSLIDDITGGDVTEAIPTPHHNLPTLAAVINGIDSGALAASLTVGSETLAGAISSLRADINMIAAALGIALGGEAV